MKLGSLSRLVLCLLLGAGASVVPLALGGIPPAAACVQAQFFVISAPMLADLDGQLVESWESWAQTSGDDPDRLPEITSVTRREIVRVAGGNRQWHSAEVWANVRSWGAEGEAAAWLVGPDRKADPGYEPGAGDGEYCDGGPRDARPVGTVGYRVELAGGFAQHVEVPGGGDVDGRAVDGELTRFFGASTELAVDSEAVAELASTVPSRSLWVPIGVAAVVATALVVAARLAFKRAPE